MDVFDIDVHDKFKKVYVQEPHGIYKKWTKIWMTNLLPWKKKDL